MPRQPESPRAGRSALRWTLSLTLLVTAGFLADRLVVVQQRLEHIEGERLDEQLDFQRSLGGMRGELATLRGELERSSATAELTTDLSDRLQSAEQRLGRIDSTVEQQASSLTELERERVAAHALEAELARRDEEIQSRIEARYRALNDLVTSAEEAAEESRAGVQRLEATLTTQRDLPTMWRELVGPVVQLAGETSVGSGVLLRSVEKPEGGYTTHLMTAWHVVRDIQGDLSKTDMPVPVFIYGEEGDIREERAKLLAFDADLDAALLVMDSDESFANGAELATRERLEEIRIFEQVYAVGCPLGNDPIPTHGEVATTKHLVDGAWYWMINAPTYIGNSGGGIFDGETHQLLGIFSKIYTHGTLRPTIVPHMGLVTPLTVVYDWLEKKGYGHIIPTTEPLPGTPTRVAAAESTIEGAQPTPAGSSQ